jgi:hypothetical protein
MVNWSVFVMGEPIQSLLASASVTTSLSQQVEATLLATVALILHTTLFYLWDSHADTDKSYICGGFV